MARTRKRYTKKNRKKLKLKKRNYRTKKRAGHITPVPNRNGNGNGNRDEIPELAELEARLLAHNQERRERVNSNAPLLPNSNMQQQQQPPPPQSQPVLNPYLQTALAYQQPAWHPEQQQQQVALHPEQQQPLESIFERGVQPSGENMMAASTLPLPPEINNHCEKLDRIVRICQNERTNLALQRGDDDLCREVISQIQDIITFG